MVPRMRSSATYAEARSVSGKAMQNSSPPTRATRSHARRASKVLRHLSQESIASSMPRGVVHELESVEIEEGYDEPCAVAFSSFAFDLHALFEATKVEQFR